MKFIFQWFLQHKSQNPLFFINELVLLIEACFHHRNHNWIIGHFYFCCKGSRLPSLHPAPLSTPFFSPPPMLYLFVSPYRRLSAHAYYVAELMWCLGCELGLWKCGCSFRFQGQQTEELRASSSPGSSCHGQAWHLSKDIQNEEERVYNIALQ